MLTALNSIVRFMASGQRLTAFRTELWGLHTLFRFPAAFIAPILGDPGGLGLAALGAEFSLIHSTAGASPSVCRRLRLSAVGTELPGIGCTAGADPASGRLGNGFGLAAALTELTLVAALAAGAGPAGGRRGSLLRLLLHLLLLHLLLLPHGI